MEEILNGMATYFRDNNHEKLILKPEFQNGYYNTLDYKKSTMTLNEIFKEITERGLEINGFGFSEEEYLLQVDIVNRYSPNKTILRIEMSLLNIGSFLAAIKNNNIHIDDFYKEYLSEKLIKMRKIYDAFSSLSDEDKLYLELLSNEIGDD